MEGEGDDSLDLSHLSEEEQSIILRVLLRDAELRNRDDGRVRNLRQTETDPARLRNLSGSWFSDERSKRHWNCKSGSDLVHATIRHRKPKGKDVPLAELFNGLTEEVQPNHNGAHSESPEADRSLEESKESEEQQQQQEEEEEEEEEVEEEEEEEEEKERGGSPQNVEPTPTRLTLTQFQHRPDENGSISSKEYDSRSNGHSEDTEEDSDSVCSSLTDADPASLRTSSSTGSLRSTNALGGSMMSLFSSGDFGLVEVRGRIQFSMFYDSQKQELIVKVHQCEDLASARNNRSDPYVKAYLLPDKTSQSKKKTSVKKKTLSPVYDQTLNYKVRIGELRSRTLNLSVWHFETLRRNVFLGEVEVNLGVWDWTSTQPLWQELQPRVHMSPDSIISRGNLMFSVKFIPEGFQNQGLPLTGELHIWLREAHSLLSNKGSTIDSFVKSYILPDASRQSRQKTRVLKHSISPTYNHTMVYDGFHSSDLREACAELTVWRREGLKTHMMGGIRLSCGTGQSYGVGVSWMDSTEEEVGVWNAMMQNPNHWIDTTLPIRTNLTHRPK
ncbi:synaptotagmin-like protein 1 [Genypterus blacodes]|uniref:synaptotagmin-like protein 1 n=1 Tax=Genypterus blacodes TaxID=154954 RepID=UPI003F768CA5